MANNENLKPIQKGEVRNPNGRPKGTKNWSTIVQRILADERVYDAVLEGKAMPAWINKLPNKNLATAIATAMAVKALTGDKQSAEWLRKTGFGDKLDITSGEEKIQPIQVVEFKEREKKNE